MMSEYVEYVCRGIISFFSTGAINTTLGHFIESICDSQGGNE